MIMDAKFWAGVLVVSLACTSTSTSDENTSDEVGEIVDAQVCVDACLKFACDSGPPAGAAERCETPCASWADQVAAAGEDCVDAWSSLLECVVAAPCESYSFWLATMAADPCVGERDAFDLECPGVVAGL